MEGSAQRLAQDLRRFSWRVTLKEEPDPHMCESDDVQKAWKEAGSWLSTGSLCDRCSRRCQRQFGSVKLRKRRC